MARRWFLSLLALMALLSAGVHGTAMAASGPMARPEIAAPAARAEAPCHAADAEKAAAPAKPAKPAKPACCADGCDTQCSPVMAFFASAPGAVLGFLRAVVEAEAIAQTPDARPDRSERPPRLRA